MIKEKRVELHLHTVFSAMDALVNVSKLICRAAHEEWPAVAITDHSSLQAFPQAQMVARKHGVKVIYGVELTCSGSASETNSPKYHHVILLVKNKVGLKNLYKLVSYADGEESDGNLCVPKSIIDEHREGLLIGSACVRGELFNAVLSGKSRTEIEQITAFFDYIEIQPVCNNRTLISSGAVKNDDELRRLNLTVAELAAQMHKPFVATGDVHFLDPEDEVARRILISDSGNENVDTHLPVYYKSTEEMLDEFAYLGADDAYAAVITNTRAIADCVEWIEPVPQAVFLPQILGVDGEIESESKAQAQKIYGNPLPASVKKRLNWELAAIKKNGSGVYFAIAKGLVKRSGDNGFTVGPRGSMAASLIAFLLGITEINPLSAHYICGKCGHSEFASVFEYTTGFDLPIKQCPICGQQLGRDGFNIPPETFFGEDGSKVPDVGFNFASDYHERAKEHLKEIFGRERVLRTGVVRTVSEELAMGFAKSFAIKNGVYLSEDEITDISFKLGEVKRDDEIQPGTYVIIPNNMEAADLCPVREHFGEYVAHFDAYSMSRCLIRVDILGHDTPTLLKELEEKTATDSRAIPLDDEDTLRLFEDADTVAIPEFGSDIARRLLKTIKPIEISELIKVYGLIHGAETWDGNAEDIINSTKATIKEVISTRDDVFIFLMGAGMERHDAYTAMEYVRKGRFYVDSEISDSGAAVKRCAMLEEILRSHEVPGWYIDSMKKIHYLIAKAHAAAYSLLSFRVAWYKAHYPMDFYVAMLNRIEDGTLEPDDSL